MIKFHRDPRLSILTTFNQLFEEQVNVFADLEEDVAINTDLGDGSVAYERNFGEYGLRTVKVVPVGNNEIRVSLIGNGEINTIRFDRRKLMESKEWFNQFIQFLVDGSLKLLKESN